MKESIFAAWHPVEGFGPTNEISLRDHYDHAMTDVRLLSHTGDKRWCVVEVEMKVCPLRTLATVPQFKRCSGCYTEAECREAARCFASRHAVGSPHSFQQQCEKCWQPATCKKYGCRDKGREAITVSRSTCCDTTASVPCADCPRAPVSRS